MYESFYKLRKPPFRLTPDPYFFFGSSTHKRGLAYLRYAVQQGEGFVVITGGPGTGKTELMLNLLEAQLHPSTVFAKIVSSNLNADDLLELVAASFGLSHEGLGKGALLKKLEVFLIARSREGKQVLLLIDEAHNLSTTSLIELSMLSNFQLGEKALLQCFLLGQEPLEQKLQKSDLAHLKQRVIASTHLDPMDEIETREYINHRLTQAGWKNDPQIHDSAYPLIHTFSGGIPRQINSFCNRLLLQGFIDETHEIDIGVVRSVIAEVLSEVAVAHAPYTVSEPAIDPLSSADTPTRRDKKPRAASVTTNTPATPTPTARPVAVDTAEDEAATFTKQARMPLAQKPASLIPADNTHHTEPTTVHAGIEDADALQELARHGAGRLLHTLTEDSQLDRELRSSVALFVNAGFLHGTHHTTGRELSLLASPSVVDSNKHPSSVWKWAAVAGISVLALGFVPQLRLTDGQIPTSKHPSSEITTKPMLAATDSTLDSGLDGAHVSTRKAEQPDVADSQFNNDNTIVSDKTYALVVTHNDDRLVMPIEEPFSNDVTALSTDLTGPAEQLVQKQEMPETPMVVDQKAETEDKQPHTVEHAPITASLARNGVTPTTTVRRPMDTSNQQRSPVSKALPATPATPASPVNSRTKRPQPEPVATKAPSEKRKPAKLATTTKKSTIAASTSPTTQRGIDAPVAILPIPTLASVTPGESRAKRTASPTNQKSHEEGQLSDKPIKPLTEIDTGIAPAELDVLVSKLTAAYEAGNLRKLVSIFADNARSNDSVSIDEIENDYRQLFNVTDMRRMIISGIQWSKLEDQMQGKGNFQLYVREKGAGRITSYGGNILFDVMKSPQGILITQLNYQYSEL